MRTNFLVIERQIAELCQVLEGLPVPTRPLEGTRNPWGEAIRKASTRSITEFDPIRRP